MEAVEIKHFVEAALLAAGRPLNLTQIHALFDGRSAPEKSEIREAIDSLNEEYKDRGIVISEVASGFRIQVRQSMADRLHKLWEGRAPRYSRALFETLALVAYRQPITRGEIEEIRGVAVSPNIIRTLLERDWVRVVGHRDVPGRPEMFGTTKMFLDYFGLKKLEDLPPLADLADWETVNVQLDLPEVGNDGAESVAPAPTELPVLYPEHADPAVAEAEAETEQEAGAGDGAAGQAADDPEAGDAEISESGDAAEEELVVQEWPDPLEYEREDVQAADAEDIQKDPDASATGR